MSQFESHSSMSGPQKRSKGQVLIITLAIILFVGGITGFYIHYIQQKDKITPQKISSLMMGKQKPETVVNDSKYNWLSN